jgi:pyrophosphatase PpaX
MPHPSKPLDLRAVLFDVDGTLIDSVGMIVRGIQNTFLHYALPVPGAGEIRRRIGIPLRLQLPQYDGAPTDPVQLQQMATYCIAQFEEHSALERSFEPAIEALERLHQQGFRTALVTSKSREEIIGFANRFRAMKSVDFVVSASDVFAPKPAPDAALLACQKLEVNPSDALLIGDSIFDLMCGKAAGTFTAAVQYGAGDRTELLAHSPDLTFETPSDLLDWAVSYKPEALCPVSP